jgi:hypothetical protein
MRYSSDQGLSWSAPVQVDDGSDGFVWPATVTVAPDHHDQLQTKGGFSSSPSGIGCDQSPLFTRPLETNQEHLGSIRGSAGTQVELDIGSGIPRKSRWAPTGMTHGRLQKQFIGGRRPAVSLVTADARRKPWPTARPVRFPATFSGCKKFRG